MHSENEVVYLYLDDIIPNRFQPREVFEERALKELAISIKEHGVIQPIIVRKISGKYEIIAGERRYKASALAGLTKIPAIVRDLDDKESSKVALLENLQRRNLNPIEESRTYQKILELDQMTQEDLAKTMGKSQSAVANKLRLLALPEEIQVALLKEQISERHARTLLNLPSAEAQKEMLKKVIDTKMTVRELEQEIRGNNGVPQNFSNQPTETSKMDAMLNDARKEIEPSVVEDAIKFNGPTLDRQADNIQLGRDDLVQTVPIRPQLMDKMDQSNNYGPMIMNPLMDNFNDTNTNLKEDSSTFINYGEINNEEDDGEEEEEYNFGQSTASSPIDLDQLKANAMDIPQLNNNTGKQKISADLDDLLNIAPPKMSEEQPSDRKGPEEFKFFTPPQEEESKSKKSQQRNQPMNTADLFNTPDLISFAAQNNQEPISTEENVSQPMNGQQNLMDLEDDSDLPEVPINDPNENNHNNDYNPDLSLGSMNETLFQQSSLGQFGRKNNFNSMSAAKGNKSLSRALMDEHIKNNNLDTGPEQYNVQQMINSIRQTLSELERHGAKIDTDEMDFENQYQIVIKIDKTKSE